MVEAMAEAMAEAEAEVSPVEEITALAQLVKIQMDSKEIIEITEILVINLITEEEDLRKMELQRDSIKILINIGEKPLTQLKDNNKEKKYLIMI
mmetsp:Transcript_17179/g.26598  ORF Transcript_17179/g.26598 Transcript_17179/m.26598 type:complete len:94 (+) Transcript_17179:110-391(+)